MRTISDTLLIKTQSENARLKDALVECRGRALRLEHLNAELMAALQELYACAGISSDSSVMRAAESAIARAEAAK